MVGAMGNPRGTRRGPLGPFEPSRRPGHGRNLLARQLLSFAEAWPGGWWGWVGFQLAGDERSVGAKRLVKKNETHFYSGKSIGLN